MTIEILLLMETAVKIIQIFIPIILGYLLKTIRYIPEEIGPSLRMFVLRVTVPLLILSSMMDAKLETLVQILPISLSFLCITSIMFLFSFLIFLGYKNKERKTIFMWMITFGNYAWIGWSVLHYALGEEGFNRGIFFSTFWWPTFLSLGFLIALLNKTFDRSKIRLKDFYSNIFTSVGALGLGIGLNLAGISFPEFIQTSMDSFGNMTIPIILFTVGLSISFKESIHDIKAALPLALIRPVLGGIAGILTVALLGLTDSLNRQVVLLESTMPTAAMLIILADIFGLNRSLAASLIVVSTLVALGTIPLAILLIHQGILG